MLKSASGLQRWSTSKYTITWHTWTNAGCNGFKWSGLKPIHIIRQNASMALFFRHEWVIPSSLWNFTLCSSEHLPNFHLFQSEAVESRPQLAQVYLINWWSLILQREKYTYMHVNKPPKKLWSSAWPDCCGRVALSGRVQKWTTNGYI